MREGIGHRQVLSAARAAGIHRRVAALDGREPRLARWCEVLRDLGADAAAAALDEAVRAAALRDPAGTVAFLPILDVRELSARVGPGVMADILAAARAAALEGSALFLEDPGPPRAPERLGPPADPVVEALSLGQRKTAARGSRSPLLDRILKDPDPRVVAEVLRNPRLREHEVLAIGSRRPCPAEVFWQLARSEHWVSRPAVRRAIVYNPYAPPRLAVALAILLTDGELDEVLEAEGLHPAVRDGALQVLTWRREE